MNILLLHNKSNIICHILIVWLINVDGLYGCLSMDYKNKESVIPNNKLIQKTVKIDFLKIIQFKDYMSQKYNMKLEISDLQFLWIKLNEFTRLTKQNKIEKTPIIEETKEDIPNITYIDINDIESYLTNGTTENKLIGVLNMEGSSQRISSDGQQYFDATEMYHAFESTRLFHLNACKLINVTFCAEKFLKESIANIHQYLPPAISIKRCPKACSCLQPNEDCLPTSINRRKEYFWTINGNKEKYTWPVKLEDHTGCKCKDRCQNRKCIYPFEIRIIRKGVCKCTCIPGFENKCTKLLEGYINITSSDYKCIVNGTCISPSCRAGELSEEHLYLKRCPKVLY